MNRILILAIISCCLVNYTYTASKYYDGPIIPYKFGFSIENYQHRHEEKDEKGQIMGEYGFVTADGVYHVTGYGTDENGNYKILFMRNIKIGLPGEPGSQPASTSITEEKKDIPIPTTKLVPISKPSFDYKFEEMIPSDIPTCSGCVIPEPKKKEPIAKKPKPSLLPASFIRPDTELNARLPPKADTESPARLPPKAQSEKKISELEPVRSIGAKTEIAASAKKLPISPKVSSKVPSSIPAYKSDQAVGLDVRVSEKVPSNGRGPIKTVDKFEPNGRETFRPINQIQPDSISKERIRPGKGDVSKKTLDGSGQKQLTGRPEDRVDFGKQISPSGIDISSKSGITKLASSSDRQVSGGVREEDRKRISTGLLYKFNYTVGYHGHHEQGDAVGAKDGGYYFIGRDGYKRTVDYNANEFGFQPHVKLVQATPQETPQEETEKEAGLKGYEFKWFNI